MKEPTRERCGGKVFQAKGTESAKALSLHVRRPERPVWQEHREQGGDWSKMRSERWQESGHVWACSQGEGLGFTVNVYVRWGVVET